MAHVTEADEKGRPVIAILPWGDVIEDFLAPLDVNARSYLRSASGGWLFGYVLALKKAGWRPLVIWASREVTEVECMVHPGTGASVWLVPGRSRAVANWNARTSLRRWLSAPIRAIEDVIRHEHCNAILTQEYEDPRFDLIVRLGRRLGLPVFASYQGGDWTASWLEEWVRPRSMKRSSGLIIASRSERNRVEQKYAGRLPPIAEIPNPLRIEEWQPLPKAETRRSLGIDQNIFLAFNHGRIDIYRKGLDTLIDAWTRFRTDEQEHLVMIGSGQDAMRFGALLDKHQPPGVNWRNEYTTDRDLIRRWLSAADVYVTASRVEGMPVAPLEAMACGLPIIATEANGLADILAGGEGCGGLLVPPGDAVSFSDSLRKLRGDADYRAQLGKAARKRVKECYSIDKVASDLKAFISR